jgi:hypothetical protein
MKYRNKQNGEVGDVVIFPNVGTVALFDKNGIATQMMLLEKFHEQYEPVFVPVKETVQ